MKQRKGPSQKPKPPELEIDDESLQALARQIRGRWNFDILALKPRLLVRRIASRLRVTGSRNLDEYSELLAADPEEWPRLSRALAIQVSRFFRNPETFASLRKKVLPRLLDRVWMSDQPLVLVSAGCAYGEELYSLAMVVAEEWGAEIFGDRVRLVGVDLDPAALERARAGVYSQRRLSDLPRSFRKWVSFEGQTGVIREQIRGRTEWRVQDLQQGVPVSGAALILCRNLLMYYQRESQQTIRQAVYDSLVPGGYLVLGRSEILGGDLRRRFQSVDLAEHIYQKAGE